MNGISKSKHEHIIEALVQLELLLQEPTAKADAATTGNPAESGDSASVIKQAAMARAELEEIFTSYNSLLTILAEIIKKYDELYGFIRMEYVSKRLKDLRRKIPPHDAQFQSLRDSIHTVHGA